MDKNQIKNKLKSKQTECFFLKENQNLTKVHRIILFNILLINNKNDLIKLLLNSDDNTILSYFHGLPFFVKKQWNNIKEEKQPDSVFNQDQIEKDFSAILKCFLERERVLLKTDYFKYMTEVNIKLLHLMWDLYLEGNSITSKGIAEIGINRYGLKLKGIDNLLKIFTEKGFLENIEDKSEYILSSDCFIVIVNTLIEYPIWKYVYNDLNSSALNSNVYRDYCYQTYRIDLCQLGQVTKQQMDKLIEVYEGNKDSVIFEPGAGTGHISEYIYDRIDSEYYSTDLSDYAIDEAIKRNKGKRERLHFKIKNIYNLDYKEEAFDAIIAVDSLQYLLGLDDVLKKFKTMLKPGGILYSFWESWINDEKNLEMKEPGNTRLGKILKELNLEYETWDFSDDNKNTWYNTVNNLKQYKDDFIKDGAQLIYQSRLDEISRIDNSIESSRFLYKIKLG